LETGGALLEYNPNLGYLEILEILELGLETGPVSCLSIDIGLGLGLGLGL